jgi:hypothetical protein
MDWSREAIWCKADEFEELRRDSSKIRKQLVILYVFSVVLPD